MAFIKVGDGEIVNVYVANAGVWQTVGESADEQNSSEEKPSKKEDPKVEG